MLKRLIASALAAATVMTSAVMPASAHYERYSKECYSQVVDRKGAWLNGDCIPYPVKTSTFNGLAKSYMETGLKAVIGSCLKTADWNTAIINFKRAWNVTPSGTFAEAEIERALQGAIYAKQEKYSGGDAYTTWLIFAGNQEFCTK